MGKHKEKTSLSNVQDMIRSFIPDKQPLTHRQLLECRKILNVIKLNEELTAENARLLTEIDEKADVITHLNQWQESYKHYYQLEVNHKVKLIENVNNLKCKVIDLQKELFTVKEDLSSCSRICAKHTDKLRRCCIELTSIKSKWWYKLMTYLKKN